MIEEKQFFATITAIRNKQIAHAYIIIGDISELKNFLVEELKKSLKEKYHTSARLTTFPVKKYSENISNILSSSIFLTPQIFFLNACESIKSSARSAASKKKNDLADLLMKLPHKPPEHIVVCDFDIVQWQWSKANFAREYQASCTEHSIVHYIYCFEVQENHLPQWIKEFCKLHDYDIELQGIQHIIDTIGKDTGRIIQELQKLFIFILPERCIRLEHIKNIISTHKAVNDFQLIDAFCSKNISVITSTLLLLQKENHEPMDICRSLRYEAEKMLCALEHDAAILADKGISQRAIPFLIKRAQHFSIAELHKILISLDDTEKLMKEDTKISWDMLFAKLLQNFT